MNKKLRPVNHEMLAAYNENEMFELSNKLIELGIIPFDLVDSEVSDLFYFGYLGIHMSGNVGKYAKITNLPENKNTGIIVADHNGRIIIALNDAYYGWASEYKILDVYESDKEYVMIH